LTDRAERLEGERDQQVALAAAAERTRIAREMHDIVAHNLTVMVTLSEAAAAAVPAAPERSAEIMRDVSAVGRGALADTRRLLGVLRQDSAQPAADALRPVPGLAQLDELVGQVRSAGLDTTLEIGGQVPDLSEAMQLTVYRLVQEALTNTLKHAGQGARATVRLRFLPGELRVDIRDNGAGNAGTPPRGSGSGLPGMRERVRAFGGDVEAGPLEPHGWQVSARLDLDAA
jgi:signal transduction histidine kinase